MNDKTKIVCLSLGILFMMSSVTAVWVFALEDDALFGFTSEQPDSVNGVSIIQTLDDVSFNTTSEAVEHTESMIFNYANGGEPIYEIWYNVTKTDLSDGLCDFEDDVVVEMWSGRDNEVSLSLLPSGFPKRFDNGDIYVDFKLIAPAKTCPQDVKIDVWLVPVA